MKAIRTQIKTYGSIVSLPVVDGNFDDALYNWYNTQQIDDDMSYLARIEFDNNKSAVYIIFDESDYVLVPESLLDYAKGIGWH